MDPYKSEMGMSLANQNLPMTFPQLSRTDLKSSNIRMCEGEIRTSLFQMVPFKIPRPDGLPPAIFQYFNSKKWCLLRYPTVFRIASRNPIRFYHELSLSLLLWPLYLCVPIFVSLCVSFLVE